MRHRGRSSQENIGPVRRIARGVGFILLTPVMLVVGIIMLPFVLIARLFGFRPGKRFARHGCGGRGRGGRRGDESTEDVGDVGTTAAV